MPSLSDIAKEATSFVSEQLDDTYNKYLIEKEMRWVPSSLHKAANDIMPELISSWQVNEEHLILVKCVHHDAATYAFAFTSLDQMEKELKGDRFFLNPFCTYVIPIINGKVRAFNMYDDKGRKIEKDKIMKAPVGDHTKFRIEWK